MPEERFYFWDRMRIWSVYAVLLLHAGMTYMIGVPAWWYVIDRNQSLFFLYLVLLLDIFPMSMLFFIAGHFASPTLRNRGRVAFFLGKMRRIAVPWVIGVLFVAPFFSAASMRALGYPVGNPLSFYTTLFFGPAYQQGPYWFLGVLLAFFLLFLFIAPFMGEQVEPSPINGGAVLFCWIASVGLYYAVGTVQPNIDAWLNVGFVLYFQHLRVGGYLLIFFLGAYAWKKRWFELRPSKTLALAVLVSALFLLGVTVVFRLTLGAEVRGLSLLLYAAVHQGAALLTTFAAALCLRRWGNGEGFLVKTAARASFGLYWVHMIILMLLARLLVNLNWPPGLKFVIIVLLTLQIGERGTLMYLNYRDRRIEEKKTKQK